VTSFMKWIKLRKEGGRGPKMWARGQSPRDSRERNSLIQDCREWGMVIRVEKKAKNRSEEVRGEKATKP